MRHIVISKLHNKNILKSNIEKESSKTMMLFEISFDWMWKNCCEHSNKNIIGELHGMWKNKWINIWRWNNSNISITSKTILLWDLNIKLQAKKSALIKIDYVFRYWWKISHIYKCHKMSLAVIRNGLQFNSMLFKRRLKKAREIHWQQWIEQ